MRKLIILSITILLVLLPMALAVGCQQQAAPAPAPAPPQPAPAPVPAPASTPPQPVHTPAPVPAPPPKPAIASKTYTNAKYNFSVEYPADWDLEEGIMETIVLFGGPLIEEVGFMINMNIASEELPKFPKITLQDYGKISEMNIKKAIEGYKKLNEYSTTIGGQPALVLTYTGVSNKIALTWAQAFLLKENEAYVITYTAPPESHEKYMDCLNLTMSTFKLD